jgi:hypothetical protein
MKQLDDKNFLNKIKKITDGRRLQLLLSEIDTKHDTFAKAVGLNSKNLGRLYEKDILASDLIERIAKEAGISVDDFYSIGSVSLMRDPTAVGEPLVNYLRANTIQISNGNGDNNNTLPDVNVQSITAAYERLLQHKETVIAQQAQTIAILQNQIELLTKKN